MTTECEVGVLGPDGHAETTAEAHAEQGDQDVDLKRVGKCKSHAPAPGMRLRQKCSRRWRSRIPGLSNCRQTFASILADNLF